MRVWADVKEIDGEGSARRRPLPVPLVVAVFSARTCRAGCLLGQSARPLVQGGIELCRTRDRQLAVRRDSVMSDASPPGAGPNRRFVTPNM